MRRIVLITIGTLLATAGSAAAQATSTATPDRTGRGSKLHFDVDGLAAPISGRLPSALQLKAPGFGVNLNAVAKRCSQESAKLNECPRASRLGVGTLVVGVTAPGQVRDATIPINVYLHSKRQILAVAYVLGWRVVPATFGAAHGLVVNFDPLPKAPPFQGVSYTFKRISFDLGTRRTISTRKRGGGRVKRRVDLIRNPAKCNGTWASSVALKFPDGSVTPLAAPTKCSRK
jgi:hypothetical protein